MNGFIDSLSQWFKKRALDIFLLISAVVIALFSWILFIKNNQLKINQELESSQSLTRNKKTSDNKIIIDIAGAVEAPGVYEVTEGARLKDVILLAQGLSSECDLGFFNRNFNQSRFVFDQEKIYIPSVAEINSGIFYEVQKSINYLSPNSPNNNLMSSSDEEKISLNNGSIEELDTLPGVGKITAQRIIDNRPYKTLEEILTKKVVSQKVYDQIKSLVEP
ncbi:MAG: helix-hairpin-helix domain-containing protein [Microgenomates group bacterium]|nr:helix-hairpin-helix domain-containing protein [Microgenomates group bacterium]